MCMRVWCVLLSEGGSLPLGIRAPAPIKHCLSHLARQRLEWKVTSLPVQPVRTRYNIYRDINIDELLSLPQRSIWWFCKYLLNWQLVRSYGCLSDLQWQIQSVFLQGLVIYVWINNSNTIAILMLMCPCGDLGTRVNIHIKNLKLYS